MGYLSREDILKADDRETRDVHVPEWRIPGTDVDTVQVRALSGTDRDAYQRSMMSIQPDGSLTPDTTNLTAKLVSRSVVDPETGEPMFNEFDIGLLGQRSAAALKRVYDAAAELSGITERAVEDAEGNSDAAPSGDSISS